MIERVIQKELNIYRNRSSFVKERKRELNDLFEVAACMKIMTEKTIGLFVFICTAERSICFSNPCMNGGTCLDETYGYRCSCRVGYSGINCQRKCKLHLLNYC